MSQISASAKSATPRNSLIRLDNVDSAIQSDLHQHRQHERPSSRPLLEKPAQLGAQFLGHQSLIRTLFDARDGNALGDDDRRILEERLGLVLPYDPSTQREKGGGGRRG